MSNSAISRLDNDILLIVLDLITSRMPQWLDTVNDRPLTTVRFASQVCHRWRVLLLASRWIWGRVIDLDIHGGPGKVEWLEEVSRRAGSAPLWIHGRVENPTVGSPWFSTQAFFIQLLQSWERIERFSVIIDSDDEKIINDIQSCFKCRSPILKSFDVYFDSIFIDTLHPGSSRTLFADYAPSLRTIRSNQMAYKQDSLWLSNICEISSFPKNLNLNDIFVLLQHTPLIERIGLYEDVSWNHPAQSPFPKSTLPNLSSITVFSSLAILVKILDHITTGRLSSLFLSIWDRGPNDLILLTSLIENLPSYVSSYFTSNVSTTLFLWITDKALRICDVSNTMVDPDGQKYKFEVVFRTIQARDDWDRVVASLLDAFALAFTPPFLFRTITQIQLPLLIIQPRMIPNLYLMLSGFQHVTCVLTSEQSSGTLYALSCLDNDDGDAQNVIFPLLHPLRLTSLDSAIDNEHRNLLMFIKRRKSIGFPLAKLDLTSCGRSRGADVQDLRVLEEVHGLEVVWKQRGDGSGEGHRTCSYICGTGNAEQLKVML